MLQTENGITGTRDGPKRPGKRTRTSVVAVRSDVEIRVLRRRRGVRLAGRFSVTNVHQTEQLRELKKKPSIHNEV